MRSKPKPNIIGSIIEIFPGPETEFYRQHPDGYWRKYELDETLSSMRYRPSLFLVTGASDTDKTIVGYHFTTKKTVMITKVKFNTKSVLESEDTQKIG